MSSESWDYWYPRKEGTVEPEVLMIEKMLPDRGHAIVLDLGCGTGRHTIHFAQKGFKVHALDNNEKALGRTRALLSTEGLSASLRVHDMVSPLPFPDGFFEAIIATRVIHHTVMENIKRIAGEIQRVQRIGGYLLLQVPDYSDHEWALGGGSKSHIVIEPGTHVPLEGVEKDVPHHCFRKEELLNLFHNYEPIEMHVKSDHYAGWCLIARKTRN